MTYKNTKLLILSLILVLTNCKKSEVIVENCCNSLFVNYEDLNENNRIYLPQAFTPNGDRLNDNYKVIGTNIKEGYLKVKKGSKTLYEATFVSENSEVYGIWDGIGKENKIFSDGKYEIDVNCIFNNGKSITLYSQFCLITKCSPSLKKCILNDQISNIGLISDESFEFLGNCN